MLGNCGSSPGVQKCSNEKARNKNGLNRLTATMHSLPGRFVPGNDAIHAGKKQPPTMSSAPEFPESSLAGIEH